MKQSNNNNNNDDDNDDDMIEKEPNLNVRQSQGGYVSVGV